MGIDFYMKKGILMIKTEIIKWYAIILLGVHSLIAKPMEPLDKYNIIMVHGAVDSEQGFDCSDVSRNAKDWDDDYQLNGSNKPFLGKAIAMIK
jgi:hypothetical protein